MRAGCAGRAPVLPMDMIKRSRGVLHRRMNVTSNCLAATFLKVTFDAKKRARANALLKERKMIWRMPETSKKRAKTISAGNDARRFMSDSKLLVGLFAIFYPDATGAETEAMAAAADANEGVRTAEMAKETAAVAAAAPAAAAPAAAKARGGQSRKSPIGVAGGGVKKKAPSKKKVVTAVSGPGGKRVGQADVQQYAAARRRAASAPAATSGGALPTAADHAAAKKAETAARGVVADEEDISVELEDELMDEVEEDNELEEDDKIGGLASAIDVWLTAILYMAELHATLDDPFDKAAVKSMASKVGAAGKAWAIAINNHTSNRSSWQYVHDAYAHVEQDILEHGPGDRNDDSILEKKNRLKKRLGDRCVFKGGTNAPGATFTQTIRVKERDERGKPTGRFITKTVSRKANIGVAAQVQKLDFAGQILEAKRESASAKRSAAARETKVDEHLMRQAKRQATEAAIVELDAKVKGGGAGVVGDRDVAADDVAAQCDHDVDGVDGGGAGGAGGAEGAAGAAGAEGANADCDDACAAAEPLDVDPMEGITYETINFKALDEPLQKELKEIEAKTMAGYERNGVSFDKCWDQRMVLHVARDTSSRVVGFAIHHQQRHKGGKVFLYELHSTLPQRGIGSALLELVVEPIPRRSRAKLVELNVHKQNDEAQAWYVRRGFKYKLREDGEREVAPGGLAYVMVWEVQ